MNININNKSNKSTIEYKRDYHRKYYHDKVKNNYENFYCDACQCEIHFSGARRHERSKRHLMNIDGKFRDEELKKREIRKEQLKQKQKQKAKIKYNIKSELMKKIKEEYEHKIKEQFEEEYKKEIEKLNLTV